MEKQINNQNIEDVKYTIFSPIYRSSVDYPTNSSSLFADYPTDSFFKERVVKYSNLENPFKGHFATQSVSKDIIKKEKNLFQALETEDSNKKNSVVSLDGKEFKEFQFLDKIAFELEGAWFSKKENLHSDLSFSRDDFHPKFSSVGEYVSAPFNNFKDFYSDLIKNWPDDSCKKCGFHVHFSLKNPTYYSVCMERDFYTHFLLAMEDFGDSLNKDNKCTQLFWERFNGINKYCSRDFIPDFQAEFKEKGHNRHSRRTQLNYCYNYLKTIECRLFPMFSNIEDAIRACETLFNFIENYILKSPLEKKVLEARVDLTEVDYSYPLFTPKFNFFQKKMEIKNKKNKPLKFQSSLSKLIELSKLKKQEF